jgi:inorganic pyrophosphatase
MARRLLLVQSVRLALSYIVALAVFATACGDADYPDPLPATAVSELRRTLDASRGVADHPWRDVAPMNPDGTINAYIEVSRGDHRKWELNMATNALEIDRFNDPGAGPFPINFGFVPQTVFYDGDPLDVIVLGPPLPGGRATRGVLLGVLLIEDEQGRDPKLVLSPVDAAGQPQNSLAEVDRRSLAEFFTRYKRGQERMFSNAVGWGSVADASRELRLAHGFFEQCQDTKSDACRVHLDAPVTVRD